MEGASSKLGNMKVFTESSQMKLWKREISCLCFLLLLVTSDSTVSLSEIRLSRSPEGDVNVGENVSLTCNASTNLDMQTYTWYKFENDWRKYKYGQTMEETFQNNNIKYYCHVKVAGGIRQSPFFSLSAFHSPRDVNIEIHPNWQVTEGNEVKINCVVNSSNPEATVTWMRNNTNYLETDMLYFRNITKRAAGEYKCVAINFLGQAESATAVLDIWSPSTVATVTSISPTITLIQQTTSNLTSQISAATTVRDESITTTPSNTPNPIIPIIVVVVCIFMLLLIITSVICWKRRQSKKRNDALTNMTFKKKEENENEKCIYTALDDTNMANDDYTTLKKPEDQSDKHIYSALDTSATLSDNYGTLQPSKDEEKIAV
ncbi:uncharacterized protein LOC122809219 isoform X1 [Protopterus annectens]|uniref:uncharacterized protein LOC122809219 isoform X1 n=1 Tax=Protopterus annectens TaxID=7888 RepID=UPI001CFA2887|nr:uncharacterized protein LOC122809219 isoform X1 [Protopterus annectens]